MVNETHNITLKTLSPVHIGSGDTYTSSEFVSSEVRGKNNNIKIIKRINFFKYYSDLSEDRQEEFLDLLSSSDSSLEDFHSKINKKDSKINKKYERYRAYDKTGTDKINKKCEIHEHIKTLDKLYIPGSSIKGAIKTAILYDLVTDEDINKIKKNFNDKKIINKYFSSKKGNSAQNSISRFMQISDTSIIGNPAINLVKTLRAISNNYNKNYKAKRFDYKSVESFVETIPINRNINTTINLTFDSNIYHDLQINDKKDILKIDYLKKVLYSFSCDLIEYELDFANDYNIDFLQDFYDNLYKKNSCDKPLIRIGAGSGLMATTILMKIKKHDKFKFDKIRKEGVWGKSYSFEFPKSRKISNDNQPFGWVQLNFD